MINLINLIQLTAATLVPDNRMTIPQAWIVLAVGACFTVLTGAISTVWLTLRADHRELRLNCESRDRAAQAKIEQLLEEIAALRGDGPLLQRCPMRAQCPMILHDSSGQQVPTQMAVVPVVKP